jgi:hypothetical protein
MPDLTRQQATRAIRCVIPVWLALALVLAGGIRLGSASAQADASGHPAEDYKRAITLFQDGQREQAVYWFYRGQLRYRIHLRAHPELRPDGDPAVFASLSETVGRPINEYAFGDIPALAATINRVLAWHQANDDPFTPKARYPAAHAEISAGLEGMRTQILVQQDQIRAQRRAHGLPNRS